MKLKKILITVLLAIGVALGAGCSTLPGWLPGFGGSGDVKDHRASFLFDGAGTRVMNYLADSVDEGSFHHIVNRCVNNGDKVIYLYFSNQGDGHPVPTSFYVNNQFGGQIDNGKVDRIKNKLEICDDRDLQVVAWLFADDSSSISRTMDNEPTGDHYAENTVDGVYLLSGDGEGPTIRAGLDTQKKYVKDVVDLFDDYISEYVVALEGNEHMDSRIGPLADYLDSLTDRKIGTHQTPGAYNHARDIGSVNHHYHQYGWGKSPGQMKSMTEGVRGAVGKPVIASEYNKSSDSGGARAQGDGAMQGGAKGTGNGRN